MMHEEEMDSDERERLAQDKLEEAIRQFMLDTGWNRGGVTTSWVLIAHQHSYGDDGSSSSSYPLVLSGREMPDHVAIGLTRTAQLFLEEHLIRYRREGDSS